jgi:twitching motility protein PilU
MMGDLAAALRAIVSQRLLRTHTGSRVPAIEMMINTALISDLIKKADFSSVREAMEQSLAEGSQSFEQDLARLITDNVVTRAEGLSHADSPNNLLWRLQNNFKAAKLSATPAPVDEDNADTATFTDFTFDVKF